MFRTLHVLTHMDRHLKRATSATISEMLGANPVFVRRMIAGLRERGVVRAEKGHGGGWELARRLDAVTLLDVYAALGEPPLFNIGPHVGHPDCLVEQAVDARLAGTLGAAEVLVRQQFAITTIADLANDFERGVSGADYEAECRNTGPGGCASGSVI